MLTSLAFGLAIFCSTATAQSFDDLPTLHNYAGEQRQMNLNDTESQLIVGSSILFVILVPFFVYFILTVPEETAKRRRADHNLKHGGYSNRYTRSADSGFDLNNMNVIQWISMLQEVYEKFEYNDIECQKRLICEVMQSPEYFGEASMKIRTGFEYAKYLEFLNLPDDFREVLDEYVDASERAIGTKTCEEYFDCPYSLKDSVKRNFYGNAL